MKPETGITFHVPMDSPIGKKLFSAVSRWKPGEEFELLGSHFVVLYWETNVPLPDHCFNPPMITVILAQVFHLNLGEK